MKRPPRFIPAFGSMALFAFGHFSYHVLTALLIPLLPLIRSEFSLSYGEAGLLVSAFAVTNGFAQLPAGWLANLIGPRIIVLISITGVAATGFFMGLSRNFPILVALLVLMGLAGGGYHTAASTLISSLVGPANRGRAFGFHIGGGSLSYFLAPLLSSALTPIWGWRGSFLIVAAPIMGFGILLYFILANRSSAGSPQPRALVNTSALGCKESQVPPCDVKESSTARPLHLIVFLILTSCISAIVASTIAFLPLFFVDQFQLDEKTAAISLSIIYSAGMWAAPIGGHLADRLGPVRVLKAVGAAIGLLILLIGHVPYSPLLSILMLIFGIVMFFRMPASESFIVAKTSSRLKSSVLGIYFFAGMEGSALLTPLLGFLIDHMGFRSSFSITGIGLTAFTIACSILLRGKQTQ